MRAAYSAIRAARTASAIRRVTHLRHASSLLRMPAMSPTMTEGGIADWKVKEGDVYAAGDVLLEVETDKATIDVEAQDDGVMGKIIFASGSKNVPVGEAIAVLAEEGDDLAKLEVPSDLSPEKQNIPKEDEKEAAPAAAPAKADPAPAAESAPAAAASTPAPSHKELDLSRPMLPAAAKLLSVSDLSNDQISKIKPTGRNGTLTKGDVLAAMGKISNPYGSAQKMVTDPMGPSGKRASEAKSSPAGAPAAKPEPPLDGPALRRLIVAGLTKSTAPVDPKDVEAEFDDVIADYFPKPAAPAAAPAAPAPAGAQDELAGLI